MLAFIGVVAVIVVVPGPDMALVLQNGLARGRRAALETAFGILNPKIALVFTTLIPQFVDPGDPAVAQTLLLAAVFICMGLVWLTSYALLVARVGAFLKRSTVRRVLNAVTGTVLTALGVRVAVSDR